MRLHVEEAGSGGVAVLCLHGIGSSSASFAHQLDGLSEHRRVLAWDAPGYARSPDPPGPPGMDGYADAAAEVLTERGIEQAHIVGLSFGGVIAVRLALRHPELVRSLVLADSTPGSGTEPAKAAAMRQRGAELAAKGPEAFAAARAPRLLSPGAPAELVEQVRRTMAASIREPGYGWAAQAMADTDHGPLFADVHAPALVLCGSEDQVTPVTLSESIAAALPNGRLEVIRRAGHLSNQEQPREFNRLVEGFLGAVEQLKAMTGQPVAVSREEQR